MPRRRSAAAGALTEGIARLIAGNGGAALIVDYGYAEPGFGETLQAMVKHTFADVLAEPGTRDLSAHVDFAALAQAGDVVDRCHDGTSSIIDGLVDSV